MLASDAVVVTLVVDDKHLSQSLYSTLSDQLNEELLNMKNIFTLENSTKVANNNLVDEDTPTMGRRCPMPLELTITPSVRQTDF